MKFKDTDDMSNIYDDMYGDSKNDDEGLVKVENEQKINKTKKNENDENSLFNDDDYSKPIEKPKIKKNKKEIHKEKDIDAELFEDKPVKKKNTKKINVKAIIIGAVALVIIIAAGIGGITVVNKIKAEQSVSDQIPVGQEYNFEEGEYNIGSDIYKGVYIASVNKDVKMVEIQVRNSSNVLVDRISLGEFYKRTEEEIKIPASGIIKCNGKVKFTKIK